MPFIISLLCPLFSGKNETVSPTATFNSLGENTILFFGLSGSLFNIKTSKVFPAAKKLGAKAALITTPAPVKTSLRL